MNRRTLLKSCLGFLGAIIGINLTPYNAKSIGVDPAQGRDKTRYVSWVELDYAEFKRTRIGGRAVLLARDKRLKAAWREVLGARLFAGKRTYMNLGCREDEVAECLQ